MTAEEFHFANGLLPEHLEAFAYFTEDRREWALPKAEALAYINWCDEKRLRVVGFDVWRPTRPGPTVVVTSAGDVDGNEATRGALRDHPAGDADGDFVFNICIDTTTTPP
jgi:hypothetical protein